MADNWFEYARRQAREQYGVDCDISNKGKDLRKFGRAIIGADTPSTMALFPTGVANETFATANTVDYIVSADNSDDHDVTVEGHYLSSGDLVFHVQTATLEGNTPVELTQPLIRNTRLAIVHAAGISNPGGPIYCYDSSATTVVSGVPQTGASVKCMIGAGLRQSEKAATAISYQDMLFITSLNIYSLRSTGSAADINFEIETRPYDSGIWRPLGVEGALRTSINPKDSTMFRPFAAVPRNHDVRVVATSDTASTEIAGHWQSVLGLVRGV